MQCHCADATDDAVMLFGFLDIVFPEDFDTGLNRLP